MPPNLRHFTNYMTQNASSTKSGMSDLHIGTNWGLKFPIKDTPKEATESNRFGNTEAGNMTTTINDPPDQTDYEADCGTSIEKADPNKSELSDWVL